MMPSHISDLKLTEDAMSSDGFVVNRIIGFIKENKNTLKTRFAEQYDEKTQPSLTILAKTLDDESFYQNILKEFHGLSDQLFGLLEELNSYKEEEDRLQPNDPAKAAIKDLIKACKV